MGALSRFTQYTTQQEPVLSVGILAALALAILSRFVTLTDDDLQLLGLILVPIVTALLARFQAWSPASVARTVEAHSAQALRKGYDEGLQMAAKPALANPERAERTPRGAGTGHR